MTIYAITENPVSGELKFGFLCVASGDETHRDKDEARAVRETEALGFEVLHTGEAREYENLLGQLQKNLP